MYAYKDKIAHTKTHTSKQPAHPRGSCQVIWWVLLRQESKTKVYSIIFLFIPILPRGLTAPTSQEIPEFVIYFQMLIFLLFSVYLNSFTLRWCREEHISESGKVLQRDDDGRDD